MHRSTAAKFALIVVLGLASSWTTSKIIAVAGSNTLTKSSPTSTQREAFSKVGRNQAAQVPLIAVPGVQMTPKAGSYLTLKSFSVALEGGTAFVDATSEILDNHKKPLGLRLMWGLLVSDAEAPNVAIDINYVDQIFTPPPHVLISPTFHEQIIFPPGVYRIEIRLYEMTPNTDVTSLKHLPITADSVIFSTHEYVTVSD